MNGISLNFSNQTEIDLSRLVAQLNYKNPDLTITLTSNVYSRSYFFRLYSYTETSATMHPRLKLSIENIFINKYPQFSNINVSIPLQEELIDSKKKLYFGSNILLTINQTMVDDIINVDRSIFNKIQSVDSEKSSFFTQDGYMFPLSKALIVYANMAVTQNNIPEFEITIQRILETTFQEYSGQLVVILAKQKPSIVKNGTIFWKLFIIPNLNNTEITLVFKEDISSFVQKLSNSVKFLHPSGKAYQFFYKIQNLFDLEMNFSVTVKGRVAEYDHDIIRNSIILTWKLSVENNIALNGQWQEIYQMIFIDSFNKILTQTDSQYYTQYLYFITKNNEPIAPNVLLSVSPNYQSIESIILSNNLTYKLVDSSSNEYSSYYYSDFLSHLDVTNYASINEIVKATFTQFYAGINKASSKSFFRIYL